MNNDSVIYSVYLEYKGRKASLMDTASAVKASTIALQDDEILYTIVSLGRLYAFAGYLPISTDTKEKEVVLEKNDVTISIDIDNIQTIKDRAMMLLTAISKLPKYDSIPDRLRGVMDDLDGYYKQGKDFDSMLNHYLRGEDVAKKDIQNSISSIRDFLQYFQGDVAINDKNIIHLAFSEVLEDLEEILTNK